MNDFIYILLIIISLVILVVVWTQYNKRTNVEEKNKEKDMDKQIKYLRFQAYERFVLFLERSRPESMLVRMSGKAGTVDDLQMLLLSSIREEFEHNFSQQIYVSETAWEMIQTTKDNLVRMVNIASKEMRRESISLFSQKLLSLVHDEEHNFTDTALALLRNEARLLYLSR